MPMKNLTKESHFATEVIGLLLGQEFVEQLVGGYALVCPLSLLSKPIKMR